MAPSKQKSQTAKTKPTLPPIKSSKLRKLMVGLGIVAGIIAFVFVYNYWQDHHDRPLASNFSYVGRDYRSGCLLLDTFMCVATRTERYYYATDIGPRDLMKEFPGWELSSIKGEGQSYSYHTPRPTDTTAYLTNECVNLKKSLRGASMCYVAYPEDAVKKFGLNGLSRRYLVAISLESYRELKSAE